MEGWLTYRYCGKNKELSGIYSGSNQRMKNKMWKEFPSVINETNLLTYWQSNTLYPPGSCVEAKSLLRFLESSYSRRCDDETRIQVVKDAIFTAWRVDGTGKVVYFRPCLTCQILWEEVQWR